MSVPGRRWLLIALPVVVLLAVVGGPWVYINVVKEDPPDRLTLEDRAPSPSPSPAGEAAGVDGTWAVAGGSEVGYRVDEVLFGQDTEAVARTGDVTGELTIAGTIVEGAAFEADMTTVSSDEERRDNQFRGRIMDVDSFPTATLTLTEPLELGSVPGDRQPVTLEATADLTVRGETRPVTFGLTAQRNGGTIEVNGAIPLAFADFGIPDASFGPATVKDNGELEFLLVFEPA